MKPSFLQHYLAEARIAVPATALDHSMHVACSAYFSYIAYLAKSSKKKLGQPFLKKLKEARQKYGNFKVHDITEPNQTIGYVIQYPTTELPERYTRKLQLDKSYPVQIVAGDLRNFTKNAAEFYPAGEREPPQVFVNIGAISGIEDRLGHPEAIDEDLHELESNIKHELQHVTQEIVLKKLHPKQQEIPTKDAEDDRDAYFTSSIEFQPQITTAIGDLKQKLGVLKSRKVELTNDIVSALVKAYVNPNGQMPEGLLKYKPYFQSPFFNALYAKDKTKWKKAVKDFHGLFRT